MAEKSAPYSRGRNQKTILHQRRKQRRDQGPYTRRAIYALERLYAQLSEEILENRQEHASLSEQMQ